MWASADGAVDDMVKKQEEITEKVEIALEGAEEFIALKEFENDMQIKELDVQSVHQSVGLSTWEPYIRPLGHKAPRQ